MEHLEQYQQEQKQQIMPPIGDIINIEKEDKKIIESICALQKTELANLQKFSDEKKTKPVHLKEFVLVEPELLSDMDKEVFKKFQEFLDLKDSPDFIEKSDNYMDYFKEHRLKYEKEARKAEVARKMIQNKKSPDEIQVRINEIDTQEDASENSKFFMDYLINRIEGEYYKAIANKQSID